MLRSADIGRVDVPAVTRSRPFEKDLISLAAPFRRDVPLRRYSTWKIGGLADYLVEPESAEQVGRIVRLARDRDMPLVVIGKGSNLLFHDDGVRGIVLRLGSAMSQVRIEDAGVVAGAGAFVPRLAHCTGRAGLSGLEHAVGIPGTLGGLIAMNGGCWGRSIGDVVEWVRFVDEQGRVQIYTAGQCEFAYRHSVFLDSSAIVVDVGLALRPAVPSAVLREMIETLRTRRKRYPLRLPNCGSVFLSSPLFYEQFGAPGAVIDGLGLKGHSIGAAAVSERHANFIVNRGRARACDVLDLIEFVRRRVRRHTGLTLQSEVRFVRTDGAISAC